MPTLILLRHGQSTWNLENRFTGTIDVELSPLGIIEAKQAGFLLKNYVINKAFSSVLKRAIDTLEIILQLIGKNIPVIRSAALNERNYGDLQGLNKTEIEEKYGKEKFLLWRRSFETIPPNGENLHTTYDRVVPYYKNTIMPELIQGNNILIVAHGNSLRALIMYLENIDGNKITEISIATGNPRVYQYNNDLNLLNVNYLLEENQTIY
ncbi:2,3-bisphosphoglycerate-dependent phosphoglycerate mutase [Belliella sp. DSM 111904]|uniref:2,3-bisphosphoglycerate-dependent phosphoglycerate mutase n=1 Tax=Belliella filtrata TaxID=2923435 RepID=A0ABS9V5G1_9BACT|nr:2,3-bisphosphoglycerate-dependent phosphoglycerate mutase [Belliella filtrata]MCH7411657.1 2,3-bisphosphoglycerate-dependent phosphoglycerate mutase [Belliella filtrata]